MYKYEKFQKTRLMLRLFKTEGVEVNMSKEGRETADSANGKSKTKWPKKEHIYADPGASTGWRIPKSYRVDFVRAYTPNHKSRTFSFPHNTPR